MNYHTNFQSYKITQQIIFKFKILFSILKKTTTHIRCWIGSQAHSQLSYQDLTPYDLVF